MGEVIFTMVHRTSMVLLALCATAHAAKFDFTDTVLSPLMQIARRHAMFTVDGAPSTNGDGKSEVHIDVNFRLREGEVADNLGSDQSIQVIFFHHDELEAVHKADLDGSFCCTIKTDMGYGCPQAGVDSNFVKTYTPIYKTQVDIAPGDGTELLHTVKVEKTGMHYLMYSSCMSDATDVLMTGHNAWLNPYGYLPGELYYNLPFHMVMSGIYVIAGLVWLALIFKHKDDGILPVQWYIGLVVLLGLIEVVTWYITYSTYNTDGRRPVPIMTTAVIFFDHQKDCQPHRSPGGVHGLRYCETHAGRQRKEGASFRCCLLRVHDSARCGESAKSRDRHFGWFLHTGDRSGRTSRFDLLLLDIRFAVRCCGSFRGAQTNYQTQSLQAVPGCDRRVPHFLARMGDISNVLLVLRCIHDTVGVCLGFRCLLVCAELCGPFGYHGFMETYRKQHEVRLH